jgi:2-polyprenyl-6-hydroxyphenyl methylase/3-demethylubiquinone-9 3-methyltransferase
MFFQDKEIAKFTNQAKEWWNLSGPFKMLHEINPVRLEYILRMIKSSLKTDSVKGLDILDVGCGGGILSIPISRLGGNISGIDLGAENIEIASKKALEEGLEINFENLSVQDLVAKKKIFDVVICSEVMEHVEKPQDFIECLSKLTKNGGIVIISTINRNFKSKLFAITIAEYLLGLIEKGTHNWNMFIKPHELIKFASKNSLSVVDLSGMAYNPLAREWCINKDLDVNYFATFQKT